MVLQLLIFIKQTDGGLMTNMKKIGIVQVPNLHMIIILRLCGLLLLGLGADFRIAEMRRTSFAIFLRKEITVHAHFRLVNAIPLFPARPAKLATKKEE